MPALDRDIHLPALGRDDALSVRYRRESGKFVISLAEADLLHGWASQSVAGRLLARWLPCLVQYWRRRATQGDEPLTLERFFSDFDLRTIAHLRWALYYLLFYQPPAAASGLERLRGYLEAFEHLSAIAAWEEAGLLLALTPASSDSPQPLHRLLRDGGYLPEAIALYERLLGRVALPVEALCLAGLSDCYSKLGDRPRAIDYSQRYLAQPRLANRAAELVGVLYTLASSSEAIADSETAREAWQQYLAAVRTQQQPALAALPALLALGRLHASDPARACDYWQQAAALAAEQRRPREQAEALVGLGCSYYALEDYGAAIASLQQSVDLAATLEERFDTARAYLYLGGSHWALGDFDLAIQQSQHCLEQAASLSGELALVLFFLGSAHYGRREHPAAIAYLEQYLQQARAEAAPPALWQQALAELGQAHFALRNYRAAIAALQRYLEAVEAGSEPQDLRATFLTLGRAHSAEQDYPAAIAALQHYLTLLGDAPPDARELPAAYFDLGSAYLAQQEFSNAIRYLDQFAVLAPREAAVYLALGKAHCGTGDWPTAIAHLCTYLQATTTPEAAAWFYLGYARHASADWAQSQRDLQRYCHAPAEQQSAWELAEAYYCLGDIAYQQRDYVQAVECWQRFLQRRAAALPAANRQPPNLDSLAANAPAWVARDPWQEVAPSAPLPVSDRRAPVLLELGRAYAQLGEFDRATACWQELLKQSDQPQLCEAAWFELGGAREILGRYDEAIAAYQQALALADERGDLTGTGRATGRIGMVQYYRGDYDKALALLHKHLRVVRQMRERRLEGGILNDLGRVYAAQGDRDRALSLHQQAFNLAREESDELGAAAALASLGSVYGALGNYTQAVKHLQQSLGTAQQWQARLLQGDIHLQLGRQQIALAEYSAAAESLQAALQMARSLSARRLQALTLGAAAMLYQALGERERAQADCEQAIAIASELGLPEAAQFAALQKELAPSVLVVLWELLRSLVPRPWRPASASAAVSELQS